MSVDKQGTVKSEISPDGGLKLTIKREKTVEDACKPEWVTEARGNGLGKLVIKRKSPGSVSQPRKTKDRHTEQRPILRLSLTQSASGDGNRHVQVKSWSLCEVLPAVEDVGSVSELSPACQLQPSPKDSGIDISSPPHDDGAVGVEPVLDSHTGDSSAVEDDKIARSPEKLESAVGSFTRANNVVHSSIKAFWPDTLSCSAESEQSKVQSTLRSRRERSALKSFSSNSQKLVNPLAKSHRVGRYQHMLPVNRIRAESNVARRSSLEESPTYNMVASRTSLFSRLPRVKTKLKRLSNNTYAPVFDQQMESTEKHAANQNTKSLKVDKSAGTVAVVEHRRSRLSCKSSASDVFENVKEKLCFSYKNHRARLDNDKMQKLPKLKLVVESKAVSCVKQQSQDASVTATVNQCDENMPRHIRRKQRWSEVGKTKTCSCNASSDIRCPTGGDNAGHLPSSKAADVTVSCPKRRSSEAKQPADLEPSAKKSKVQSCVEQLTDCLPVSSDSQQSLEEEHIDRTLQSIHHEASDDKTVNDDQSSFYDVSSKAAEKGADKPDYSTDDETKLSVPSAEMDCNGTGIIDSSSVATDSGKLCGEGSDFDTETCRGLTENADDDRSEVDRQREEMPFLPDAKEEIPTAAVQLYSITDCSAVSNEETVIADKPCETINSVSADDMTITDKSSDHSGKSCHTCAAVDERSKLVTVEQSAAACSDTAVPLLLSPLLVSDCSPVTGNMTATLLPDSDGSHNNNNSKAENSNSVLNLEPTVASEVSVSCYTVNTQNNIDMVDSRGAVDSAELTCRAAACQQDIKQEMIDTKEKNYELKSVCSIFDREQKLNDECERTDSDLASLCDVPSHCVPLSSPHCNKEHTETSVANSACSNGFLAAFTQFVEKVSVKKKSASCKLIETDNTTTSKSSKEILSDSSSSQKCVRKRSCPSQRRRRTCSEKATLLEDRLPLLVHCQSASTVECVSSVEASLQETHSPDDIDCSTRLNCAAVDHEHPTLSREELLNIVASDHQLVVLRHRVCELLETLLPEIHFPCDFRRDSASVERLVKDVTDILSNNQANVQNVPCCSDPVVTLHHMPDRCLQSLQQQTVQLLSLLLPDTDLSDINVDHLEVLLELMTSLNRPLPGVFCVSQPNLHPSRETSLQPLDKHHLQAQPSAPYHTETNATDEQIDVSLSRTENHMSAVDSLCSMPSSLLQINTPAPIGDKRSIRRQVKDCLMFLDRDLT